MTTPAQGKGKKKNKESNKVPLEEFNSFEAPHGHNVVSIKTTGGTGLDWAEAMAEQVTETQQIIVPTAPRAQRGPSINFDSLPDVGPFRVSIFNLPMSVEEGEISERFFQGLDIIRIESTKTSTTVEFGSKDAMYEALCKDGSSIKGRTLNVLMYGEEPQNSYGSDRYASRGGNSSYGDRYADRDRGFGGQRGGGGGGGGGGGRFSDRSGGFSRDRDSSYGGFNRQGAGGGYGQPRGGGGGGFGDRHNDRFPNDGFRNDRYNDRPPMDRFSDRPISDRPIERFPIDHRSNERFPDRSGVGGEQRQKLDLKKRTTPLNIDDVSRNEAIFGKAKPSSKPYEKLMEIEEKLKGKE